MTSTKRKTAPAGGAEAQRVGSRGLEIRLHGHVTRAMLTSCLASASDILRDQPDIDVALWDFSALVGYDPGNPALAIQWSRRHLPLVTHSVVVTRNHVVAGLVHVGQVMIPWIKARVVSRREDALAALDEIARARPGRRTAA